jgi:hypothetical protein
MELDKSQAARIPLVAWLLAPSMAARRLRRQPHHGHRREHLSLPRCASGMPWLLSRVAQSRASHHGKPSRAFRLGVFVRPCPEMGQRGILCGSKLGDGYTGHCGTRL